MKPYFFTLLTVLAAAATSLAQIPIRDDNGVELQDSAYNDGALDLPSGGTIDLSQAQPGTWSNPAPIAGKGVYDKNKWAVVYKCSSVTLGTWGGHNVYFTKHPTHAPVVLLVDGDVNVGGCLWLDGAGSLGSSGFPEPGPGGFRGARSGSSSVAGSGGFGPGGGDLIWGTGYAAASHATAGYAAGLAAPPLYSHAFVFPLLGGSGGASSSQYADGNRGGGAGGGAILIVAKGTITIDGAIYARGGQGNEWAGGGSGGAIRLVANAITGGGALRASGGYYGGGDGRIMVQANTINLTDAGVPAWREQHPLPADWKLWPPADAPKVKIVSLVVNGQPIDLTTKDPEARLGTTEADHAFDTMNPVTVNIAAENVPLNWTVVLRIVRKAGDTITLTAPPLQGTPASSTTAITLPNPGATPPVPDFPRGIGTMQVRVAKPQP